jgi:hypothetical protein
MERLSSASTFFAPSQISKMGRPRHTGEYRIVYGGDIIHVLKTPGTDSVEALLTAMRDAARHFDGPYFNKIEVDKRDRDVIPYISAIPSGWLHNLRFAGTWPTWTVEEPAVFLHPDGQRVPGRIAIGYPVPPADPYRAECQALIDGIDGRVESFEADTPLTALQLAMASLAGKLRAFLAGGGRVLRPEGDADADLEALFGPMLRTDDPMVR